MILNRTTNEKINIKIKIADSFFKRLKGLMFTDNINYGMLFITKYSSAIHTSFMRFDIDVYFLDDEKRVFEKTTLKPWKNYTPSKKAKYILELKKDEIKIETGDKLEFI